MIRMLWLSAAVVALGLTTNGCGERSRNGFAATAAPTTSGTTSAAQSQRFEVVIENLSGETYFPTPFAPAAWATHADGVTAFAVGSPASAGLERLAEDGDPSALVAELAATPGVSQQDSVGATPPGQTTRFEFSAEPGRDARLTLASMLVQSNDAFVSSAPIELFDASGAPLPAQQVTLTLFDAGTEVNELPGAGMYQPPRQPAPNSGPAEGTVHRANHALRAIPPGGQLARIEVRMDAGELVFTLRNTAEEAGFSTPLAPLFYATHSAAWQAFTSGQPVPQNGLEALAEDGSPAQLATFAQGVAAIDQSGTVDVTLERPTDPAGPVFPGERYELRVTPDAAFPNLTLLCMVGQSNDVFLGFGGAGLALFDGNGALKDVAALQAEAQRSLQAWDTGTEANEVPGAGAFQPARQPAANTGPADPDDTVRVYADGQNDLAGPRAGGVLDVAVAAGPAAGELTITVSNTSTHKVLSPFSVILHEPNVSVFQPGTPASPGLAQLAEDGNGSLWIAELAQRPGVASATITNLPVGATAPGPIRAGDSYRIVVRPAAGARYLSLGSMIVPSNDTFAATEVGGVELMTAGGTLRAPAVIATELRQALVAWDAGSEANQVGAAGPDQAPRQAAPNTGGDEGSGLVRPFADAVVSYPATDRLLRVTVRPLP